MGGLFALFLVGGAAFYAGRKYNVCHEEGGCHRRRQQQKYSKHMEDLRNMIENGQLPRGFGGGNNNNNNNVNDNNMNEKVPIRMNSNNNDQRTQSPVVQAPVQQIENSPRMAPMYTDDKGFVYVDNGRGYLTPTERKAIWTGQQSMN